VPKLYKQIQRINLISPPYIYFYIITVFSGKILYSSLKSWDIQKKFKWMYWNAKVYVSVTNICNRSCLEIWTYSSFSPATVAYSPVSGVLLLGRTFMFDEQISCCTGDHHLSWLALHTQTVTSYLRIHRTFLPFQKPNFTFHWQQDGNFSTFWSFSFFFYLWKMVKTHV